MGNQLVDYEAVIRDMEKRRAEWNARFDAAISALREVAAMTSVAPPPTVSLPFNPEVGLRPYRGMTMIEAAMAHIRSAGHAVPNVALAKAVENGGFVHKSKNFPNTLNSILWRRSKTVGDLRKSSRGWEVVESGSHGLK